jgi:hypothetical protein
MRKLTVLLLPAFAGSFIGFLPAQVFGLAVAGNQVVALPAAVNNSILQVSDAAGSGTGTIINSYGYNGGTVFDVLTADHVVRNNNGNLFAANQVSVGFGNGATPTFTGTAITTDFTLPAAGASAVDLSVFSVFVPAAQLATLPNFTPIAVNNTVAANDAIVQSGYGDRANVRQSTSTPPPQYDTDKGKAFLAYVYKPDTNTMSFGLGYGTLLSGNNSVSALNAAHVGATSTFPNGNGNAGNSSYQFDAVTGGTSIVSDGNGGFNGTSYILSGDSGGPTFEKIGGNYVLVGVHSDSRSYDTFDGATPPNLVESDVVSLANDATHTWDDVNATVYSNWITSAEATVNATVPEPTCGVVLLATGGLSLLRRHRVRA